ncbi:nodulation protein NodH [Cognatishimia sp. SS12]|uniref:nodulation protein NodH n=1 Tax=Cognatishimia sp. SS12 TaxID=2979465 RepID=UPI00232AD2E9|nr:nodulation protein NodH [Cognatishimia sp. SS12]MDC0737675.1 nodulation protein NodH [Cognatishimia sp. SS12]
MTQQFDYFVVFAEMRTGSNFLEANINAFPGLACLGEAFNPHFIGYPNKQDLLGVSQAQRDATPELVLDAIKATPGTLSGFRFFHDHDPRILDGCVQDPRCAKIILTRNPMDSYVSWKIAQATGQWKLTDVRKRRDSKVTFEGDEFIEFTARMQGFQVYLLNALQRSGQTAFYVAYEDLQDVSVMNGLARFLGIEAQLEMLDNKLKRQNPSPLADKVENFDDIPAALAQYDLFNLNRTPNFEPRRGPAVPSYVATPESGLMFLPIQGGPTEQVKAWMAALDGVPVDALLTELNQKAVRQWKRRNVPHRVFSVLRHPVARAHASFCQMILPHDRGFPKIRRTLRNRFKLPIPEEMPDAGYDAAAHRAAFKSYLEFTKANLAGQTAIRQDGYWSTQASILSGFGVLAVPDMVLREDDLARDLAYLAAKVGRSDAPALGAAEPIGPIPLAEIYDADIEALARDVYQRDYMAFGFENWQP